LSRYRDIVSELEEAAQTAIHSKSLVFVSRRKSGGKPVSDQERHVVRNAALIEEARRVRERLAAVQLSALEAHVLYRHVWQNLPLSRLGSFLDVTEADLARARQALVEKVAQRLA